MRQTAEPGGYRKVPGRLARKEGGHHRHSSAAARADFAAWSSARPARESSWPSTSPSSARPIILGQRASGVVQEAARRNHPVRREIRRKIPGAGDIYPMDFESQRLAPALWDALLGVFPLLDRPGACASFASTTRTPRHFPSGNGSSPRSSAISPTCYFSPRPLRAARDAAPAKLGFSHPTLTSPGATRSRTSRITSPS